MGYQSSPHQSPKNQSSEKPAALETELRVSDHLLCVRDCRMHKDVISSNFHNHHRRFLLYYRWENWVSEKAKSLLEVTLLLSSLPETDLKVHAFPLQRASAAHWLHKPDFINMYNVSKSIQTAHTKWLLQREMSGPTFRSHMPLLASHTLSFSFNALSNTSSLYSFQWAFIQFKVDEK